MNANEILARDRLRFAAALDATYAALHADAVAAFGATDSPVSAIGYAGNAPDAILDRLRRTAYTRGHLVEESLQLWRDAGRTRATWLRVKDSILHGEKA